jgi:hypothetical protein
MTSHLTQLLYYIFNLYPFRKDKLKSDYSSKLLSEIPHDEDSDVTKLRKEVESRALDGKDPLLTVNLRKVYDDGHVALHNLSLLAKVGFLGACLTYQSE